MRWLFSLSVVLTILQVAACRSSSIKPQGMVDAAVPLGTGGTAGAQTFPGSGVDGGKGDMSGLADTARPADAGGGASTSPDGGVGGSSGGTRAGDAMGIIQGGSAVDAAKDASPIISGGVAGNTGGKGGTGGTGGTSRTGGASSIRVDAGAISTGGSIGVDAGADGTSVTPGTCASDSVCVVGGEVRGLFSGSGWVDMGLNDTLTDPTCGVDRRGITTDVPCTTQFNWNSENAFCMTGSVAPLPPKATDAEYDASWGIEIGVSVTSQDGTVGSDIAKYETVAFHASGLSSTGLRAIVHRKGDPKLTTYCVDGIGRGVAIRLAKFNTKCWGDVTTLNLQSEDFPKIDYFALRVPSSIHTFTASNLCLTGLSFQ